jgi:hypothetical protein
MGYNVDLVDSDFTIPESKEVLEALRAMPTKYHSLMRGGSSSGEKWFSWMNNKEIENATTAQEIFEGLGFECSTEYWRGGDELTTAFKLVGYSSKTGQEDLFLAVVAPFVAEGSYTEWQGEDGERWRYTQDDGKLCVQSSSISWNYPEEFKVAVFHSEGSGEDWRTMTLYVDPYVEDVDAVLEAKIAKVKSNG